jgi:hypothetical protein
MIAPQVKLSVRLPGTASSRLDHNARAAGLSRGVYLTRLIHGAPPVVASSDRAAMFNALNASSAELALLSRDINHLTRLLRQGSSAAAREYTARHDSLDRVVHAHLALAAPVLAELSSMRLAVKRQEVIPRRIESGDGRCAADALMRTMPVVVVRPVVEGGGTLC